MSGPLREGGGHAPGEGRPAQRAASRRFPLTRPAATPPPRPPRDAAQARWKHIRNGGARKSTDVFDPNYDFDAHFGRSGKQAKGRAGKEPTVGHGRKNPNDVRSRPKKR